MHKNSQLGFCLALLCAGSMWFYVQRVLIPYEKADALAHQRPRGNLSDLYPRWLGTRELLLRHRNPYSNDVTLEIQKGYYGRVLDPTQPNDPKDQQAFAYPAYVIFLLAPWIGFSFHSVHILFYGLLAAFTAASVWLWLRVLQWQLPVLSAAVCIVFTMGSWPAVQGIKLQQLSLLVAALLAAAMACVAGRLFFLAGALLALATVKPQLAWPLIGWMLLWAVSDWRARRSLVLGFGLVMGLLLAGAEIILPGWWRMFAQAIRQYHQYTQNQSVLDVLVPWGYAGKILAVAAVLACAIFLWSLRRQSEQTAEFGRQTALVMALTVLVVPMFAPYNQVLLLPAILLLARDHTFFSRSRGRRWLYLAGALILAWQWLASLGLCGAYLWSPAWALGRWQWPFFTTFALPVFVFALTLMDVLSHQNRGNQIRDQGSFAPA